MARPNILFLFSDEHSYRCLSLLDDLVGEPVHTPTLDALAGRGAYFSSAYCQSPLCTPSRICMLTGRSPMTSGGWANESYLKPGIPTIPAAFAAAGYSTCLVGKMHLGGANQMAGFQHRPYGDLTGRAGHQRDPLSKEDGGSEMRSRTADAGVTELPESILQEQVIVRESVSFLREHEAAHPNRPWFFVRLVQPPALPADRAGPLLQPLLASARNAAQSRPERRQRPPPNDRGHGQRLPHGGGFGGGNAARPRRVFRLRRLS